MNHCHEDVPVRRPFPVSVVTETEARQEEDGPCPRTRHEQAREKLFPVYRLAARDMRDWRREVWLAGERRKQACNPLAWLGAAGDQLYAKAELHFARKRLAVMAGQLDNTVVNRFLGWQAEAPVPVCQQEAAALTSHSPGRVAAAFATIAALVLTPLRPDAYPVLFAVTPEQRLELALAFGAVCGSSGGQLPKRESPCHAPKVMLRQREGLQPENNLA